MSVQVPIDTVAMLALAVAGAALAKKVIVRVRGDHREPVNLFVAVVMEPANRKSAVFKEVEAPFRIFERKEARRLGPVIAKHNSQRTIVELRLKECQMKAAKLKKPDERRRAERKAALLAERLAKMPLLTTPRLIADDATPESLAKLLSENRGRIALLSPDGDVFDLMGGRYSGNRQPNLGVYLKGHAGDDIRVDRVGKDRQPEFIKNPALTIGVAVQSDVLRGLAAHSSFRGRGLIGRFLYSLPASTLGRRRLDPPPIQNKTRKTYRKLVFDALKLGPMEDGSGRTRPHVLELDPGARKRLRPYASMVERGLAEGGEFSEMRDWAGKLVGAVCRIAGILHSLRFAASGKPADHLIDEKTMKAAIAIGHYLIAHAKAALFEIGANPTVDIARRILAWLRRTQTVRFSKRNAHYALRGRIHKTTELDAPLKLLEDHGYIRRLQPTRPGPGRKPGPIFDVNPVLYEQSE